ncbi:MAG: class I SAM-dependent methyltransferase [Bacteroidetes bacterium]|nr:class I SAM-dependent methyltransferase [Bacteroidota bacterium]
MKNRHWFSVLGHSKFMAVIGLAASVMILVFLPAMKWMVGITLGVVLIHVAVLLVLSLSVVAVLPGKVSGRLMRFIHKRDNDKRFNAGWNIGWMNGFWVASLVFLAATVHVYFSFPALQLLAFLFFLFSVNFFIGNLVIRSAKHNNYLVLPWVKLFNNEDSRIMDAGCGAGRSTIALGRLFPGKISAFDLFNSDYIDGGGNTLLEKNLELAGMTNRVEIVQGDITRTDYPEGTFDAVISSFMIDHLGDQKMNALNEINRILKPDGRLLMIVLTPSLTAFAILNVLSFFLTSGKKWKGLFNKTGFTLKEEGEINGGTYFLIAKN